MRELRRNKQVIHYSTYNGKTEVTDEYGNKTGEYVISYNEPIKTYWNVAFADSDAEVEMFGIDSKNILRITADRDCPIDDASILWYGITPHTPFAENAPDHNYKVVGARPSLNGFVFYASKIDTFAEQPEVEDEDIDEPIG